MIYTTTEMTEEHYYGRACVQYTAWFETHRGLMSGESLNNREPESCYESMLKHPQDICVALVDETVAGFMWCSPDAREYTRKAGMFKINVLYVLKKYQDHSIDGALMRKSLSMMFHKEAVLYVLRDDNPAVSFYRHIGFILTGNTPTQDTGSGNIARLEMI